MPHTVVHRSVADPGWRLSVRTVTDPRPGRVVVEVVGEVDSDTAPAMDVCLQSQASQPGVRELVVDLAGVTFLGNAGIDGLVRADRRCRRRGVRLVVRTGGRRAVLCPLQLTGYPGLVDAGERGGRPVPACEEHDVVAVARQ